MYLVVVDPQVSLYRYLAVGKRLGYRLLVLAKDSDASRAGEEQYNRETGLKSTNIDKLLECDTGDAESIVKALAPFRQEIAGLIPGDDPYVPATFEAGRLLGFDYAPPEDSICQQLKTAMKQRFVERGVPTAKFRIARSLREAENEWEGFGRDCMIKMVDYSASANVSRVTTHAQLLDAWDAIVSNRSSIVVPFPLAREAILEEFVDGRELSAEGYVQDGKSVVLSYCEKLTERNFVVIGHFVPAQLTIQEESILEKAVNACVDALGIRNSVFHVEIHLNNGVANVIECAARPPGQHMSEFIQRSYGFDLMEIAINLAVFDHVEVRRGVISNHYAIFALYSNISGTFDKIEGLDELDRRGGVVQCHLAVQRGDSIEALKSFRQRYGFIVFEDQDALGVREKAHWFRENVRILVAPNCQE
jgi:biotin carboxylase